MTVLYKIDPSINLIYYACFGLCTGAELLQTEKLAFHDALRRPQAKIIIDIQKAETDISLGDIHDAIELNRDLKKQGFELEKTAIIAKSQYLETFANIFRMLANELPINIGIFYTIQDATKWLEMPDALEQITLTRELLRENSK